MSLRFKAIFHVSQRQPRRRGVAVLACLILLAGTAFLLWLGRGFADYALTGLFWKRSQGLVLGGDVSSSPLVEFSTPDGATHTFSEDYILLCAGRRSLCFIRDFKIGEKVPVVYEPGHPRIAFIRDWALYSNVISWLIEAGVGLLLLLMLYVAMVQRPIKVEIESSDSGDL
jgi:hypothetical protein